MPCLRKSSQVAATIRSRVFAGIACPSGCLNSLVSAYHALYGLSRTFYQFRQASGRA
ncbi:Uncharacterised protein [Mycobacteroides abscessus subsp. abscessus]|nr:Uncharacterised protein [Mycobacteroides abscessus subsp. abscessus]